MVPRTQIQIGWFVSANSLHQPDQSADLLSRYPDLASFLRERWELGFLQNWDANDLLTLLHTWQNGDVSQIRHGGDLRACLADIQAKGLIMPSKTDLYFPVCAYLHPCLPKMTMLRNFY